MTRPSKEDVGLRRESSTGPPLSSDPIPAMVVSIFDLYSESTIGGQSTHRRMHLISIILRYERDIWIPHISVPGFARCQFALHVIVRILI